MHPHVLSAYAFDVNPNFELTVSTVAGRAETKTTPGNFPSEEEVKEIAGDLGHDENEQREDDSSGIAVYENIGGVE